MSTPTKPSIVFCHGIWADGSCFNKLIPPLQAEGYEVISAQYGLDTSEADVAATLRTLGRVHSPAILVGHSYGGAVITAAGTDDRVAGLVYIAALGPDETETSQSEQEKFPTTPLFSQIEVADGRIWMLPSGIGCFAGDLPEEEQQVVWATAWPPAASLFASNAPRHRVEDQAKLVHRGQQRPGRQPRAGTVRGQAHGRHHLRVRQQPCPHAVPARPRP
jgi:pimeloyl-ACP methyl ester carboxylesterase